MDTPGLILAVVVHAASVQDRDGAVAVLTAPPGRFPLLRTTFADGGYAGMLAEWATEVGRWTLRIVNRTDKLPRFVVLPKRWIVERTFAWLGRYRRLSKDYEQDTQSSETMILIAMVNLMLHRLAPG